jgi:hypothetical protein
MLSFNKPDISSTWSNESILSFNGLFRLALWREISSSVYSCRVRRIWRQHFHGFQFFRRHWPEITGYFQNY